MPIDTEALRGVAIVWLVRILWALVAVVAGIVASRLIYGAAVGALTRRKAHPNVVALVGNLTQLAVMVVVALVILAIFTPESFGWILTTVSVLGLVVGLSLQDILKNFFAGTYILIERPFRIGDKVRLADQDGVVEEIRFRTTQLRTDDGREVIVPNSLLMTTAVINLTRYPARSARLTVSVPSEEAGPELQRRLREALAAGPGVAQEPAPQVRLRGYAGERARYEVTVWGRDSDAAAGEAIARIRALGVGWDVQAASA